MTIQTILKIALWCVTIYYTLTAILAMAITASAEFDKKEKNLKELREFITGTRVTYPWRLRAVIAICGCISLGYIYNLITWG